MLCLLKSYPWPRPGSRVSFSKTPSPGLPVGIPPDLCPHELGSWLRADPPTHIPPGPLAGGDEVSPNSVPHGALHTLRAWRSGSQSLGRVAANVQVAGADLTGASQGSAASCPFPAPGMKGPHGGRATFTLPTSSQPSPGSWPQQLWPLPLPSCLAGSLAAAS